MPTAKEAAEELLRYNKPDDVVAVAVWGAEDVFQQAEERGIKLSLDDVNEILEQVQWKHDAMLGINWDAIDCYIDIYLASKK